MKKYRFALMSFVFVALAAYALSPATQWGDVLPTNTLAEVAAGAGLATTNEVEAAYVKKSGDVMTGTLTVGNGAYGAQVLGDGVKLMQSPNHTIKYGMDSITLYKFRPGPDGGSRTLQIPHVDGQIATTNDIAAAMAGYAYNLYPVDLGGGTRTIEMPSAQNTNNYVAVGWDVAISNDSTTCIGNMTKALGANSTAIGCNTEARADNALVVGANSTAFGTQALAVGNNAEAQRYSTAIGQGAKANTDSTALGFQALANSVTCGTALGSHAEVTAWNGVAVGQTAHVTAEGAVQIGQGTNNSNNTFKVFNRMLLDADGHVPLLTGKSYDLSDAADVPRALGDIITALGGTVE